MSRYKKKWTLLFGILYTHQGNMRSCKGYRLELNHSRKIIKLYRSDSICRNNFYSVKDIILSLGNDYIQKGIRQRKYNWEVAISRKCKTIHIGTYKTFADAFIAKLASLCNEFTNNILLIKCEPTDIYKTDFFGYFVTTKGHIINRYGEEIKGFIDRCGYKEATLSINNKGTTLLVHRLILKSIAPIKNCENLDVNHKDGNKQNNNIDNLEWCTRSYNVLHSFEHRLQDNIAGIKTYTKEEKEFIKNNINMPTKMIAQILNRNPSTINGYKRKFRKELSI